MEIIEAYLQGKRIDGTACEDGFLVTEDYVVVVDGATSHGAVTYTYAEKCVSSGEFAKEIIINEMKTMPAELNATQCMQKLHESLQSETMRQQKLCRIEDMDLVSQPRASLLIYSKHRQEIWALGDCNYCINGQAYMHEKKVDVMIAELRSMIIQSRLRSGVTIEELLENDVSREVIDNIICQQYVFENQQGEYGYPELNCTSYDGEMIETRRVREGDEIVLATDGYPVLLPNLDESEQALRQQLINDPLMYLSHKSTKGIRPGMQSFDDRCYVRVRL